MRGPQQNTATAWDGPDTLGLSVRRCTDTKRVVGAVGCNGPGFYFWWTTGGHGAQCPSVAAGRVLVDDALGADGWVLQGQQTIGGVT